LAKLKRKIVLLTIHDVFSCGVEQELNLGQRIRRYRKQMGESQEAFGRRFGVKRLAVANWEKGATPNGKHLPEVERLIRDGETRSTESVTYQLLLPFDEPINLEVRMSPRHADTIHFEVQLKRKAG
jgi:transcriptional regulator with XRE-family HTH domain